MSRAVPKVAMIARNDRSVSPTRRELAIESFFPANPATAAYLREYPLSTAQAA